MDTLEWINSLIGTLFALCYAYQLLYIPLLWILKTRQAPAAPPVRFHHFAVLICARNEEALIGDLIDSLREQTYPAECLHIFVMADNCTDQTAQIAAAHGASVYTRFDREQIGKGYALDALLSHLREDHPEGFDGYFVFDADNLLEKDYIEQMNRTFCEGHDIITSYRNSKNYGDNWISAGYGLWFLRESRYLNEARFRLGTSCAVSGTGFFFSRKIADELAGWPFHMLTEDIEFSIHEITKGRKIAFCEKAVLYDEQPTSFRQSWLQRLRWSRGYLQVFKGYGGALILGTLKQSFSCFDMSMTIMPAFFLSVVSILCNLVLGVSGAFLRDDVMIALRSVFQMLSSMYGLLFMIGAITTVSEWRAIHTTTLKKIFYMFTFPLFMFTYIPISVTSLFHNAGWKPITHRVSAKQFKRSLG
ncbi:MAG: glycosyltransferase family 2 protein [Lachnospiraceae bacterium]|nr:glycosyltransferase family 2 protein [Lachnospiraceae bacterium]